ncbi:MAG: hypothetical protein A3G38_01725 [Omnitrophica WOR_2 bacterium RIFCSPLOWO2_12_FULL_51_8]|nr:MAG: hypothetical protein A3G38_01725 [Omnitrophica WOR_2 bacterium RIFCSPLOWO2_12_FULL_51_8]
MQKVIVIGCGYGGAVCAWRLSAFRRQVEVTVLDKGANLNFLPLLPDSIGRKLPLENLVYPIRALAADYGFNFIRQEVKAIDLPAKTVFTSGQALDFDYLVVASGSETNFYGSQLFKERAYKLDDASDAQRIRQALERDDFEHYIIAGGGYTGIELAANLRRYFKRRKNIVIVERAPEILGPLPGWIKNYAAGNLKQLEVEVLPNCAIGGIEGRRVIACAGREFANAMLIWTAGVKTADFLQKLDVEKNPQGRVKVDEFLRLNNSCFVIGDAAYFSYAGSFLRMAVQFAIAQGSIAAANIIRSIKGGKSEKYQPRDLGYIIPMANNRSCGNVLGVNVRGKPATLLHYLMSVFRSPGWGNKLGIVKALLKAR